jgi:CCR4-NOT transcription complex subunit 1
MAERLSPAGAGLITNLLAELGPSCTQSVPTLRDTLRHITTRLPNNSSNNSSIDEEVMARLVYFFSERGTKVGGNPASNNTAVGTLTNDFDIGEGADWNLANIAQVFSEDYYSLNWDQFSMHFDFPDFMIRDHLHLQAFLGLFKTGSKKPLSAYSMVTPWANKSGQLSFLENAFVVPDKVFSFSLNEEEELDASTADDVQNAVCLNRRGWASSAVLQLLLELSDDPKLALRVRDVFIKGLVTYPEILLCALARFCTARETAGNQSGMKIKAEIFRELIGFFFKPSSKVRNGPAAVKRLWAISDNYTVGFSTEAWSSTAKEEPKVRLLTLTHIIRLLSTAAPNTFQAKILGVSKDFEFKIAFAFFLADHNALDLIPYLDSQVKQFEKAFTLSLIAFIAKYHPHVGAEKGQSLLSGSCLIISLKFLRGLDVKYMNQNLPDSSITIGESVKSLLNQCYKTHPQLSERLAAPSPTPNSSGSQKDDIEEAANMYFQQIYKGEKEIDEVVDMLKLFKSSGNSRETEIFACMIHNLFDEYRFFSKYPEKELRITGILFGKLIQEQLVSSITLGIALRYVLEALRKNEKNGKMFTFGMFALGEFKGRLNEWPQYCSHIVQIPGLKENYQKLVDEIETAKDLNLNKTSSVASVGSATNDSANMSVSSDKKHAPGVPSTVNVQIGDIGAPVIGRSTLSVPLSPKKREAVFGPGLGRAVNDTKEDVQHEPPNNKALDRVQHLMNNVTVVNAEQTANDIKNILDTKNFGWLGQYLVVKRISTQPNYHHVYLLFLEYLGDFGKELIEAILSSVYLNVGSLLRSKDITTSSSQRSLLKNLGSWLGQITLARNKPILQITLDCKELLYQGYETGRLFAVTPFVAKILEGAKNSQVFRSPNPWLMGLLSVFRSLYEVEDLKMNIKFEVEVLCKNLGLTLGDIPLRTDELATRIPPVKTSNPDFNIKSGVASAPISSRPSTPGGEKSVGNLPVSAAAPLQMGSPSVTVSASKDQQTVIPNLASYVTINPQLIQLFQQLGPSCNLDNATLKRCVPIAVDRAIREIIQPVVERSVTIACITTKEIVTKDFAMESDEKKMRKAAQLMVANLAGSLALVACREPLKVSVSNHLRSLLVSAATGNTPGSTDPPTTRLSDSVQNAVDRCVSTVSQENLELGCTLIEKAATEKAVRDIEESLGNDLMKRQRHREMTGKPYFDMSIFNPDQRYPAALPEPLRPKPGGLRSEQLLVYEAFQRIPRQPSAQQTSAVNQGASGPGLEAGKANGRFSIEVVSSIATKLENAVTALITQVGSRAPEITLSRIPAEHEIKQLILAAKQMTTAVASNGALTKPENDSALGFAQHIFKRLYELRLSEPLRLEAFVALLEALNICCRQLEKDLGTWATYAPTDTDAKRKLHRTVLLLLLRSKLLQVFELDNYLCERVNGGRNVVWLEFTMAFIRTAVHEKIVDMKELPKTMNALLELSKTGVHSNQIGQWLRAVEETNSAGKSAAEVSATKTSNAPSPSVDPVYKPTHQQSSSISAASLANLAGATARAWDSIEAISRDDPPGLKERIVMLLEGWMRIINDIGSSEKQIQYVQLLQQNGIGNNEEQSERFFRVSTEILVSAVLNENKSQKTLNYSVVDGYGKLVVALMKHLNTAGTPEEVASQRISLLNQILGVTMRTMMAHYERSRRENGNGSTKWDQRPWFRLLLNLVMDLNAPSPVFDPISNGILGVFAGAFHVVQPLVMPGFAFAWLELVSHRMFLSNLLSQKNQKGYDLAHQLLIDLFLFLEPHLRKIDLTESMRKLYKGTMRVLLVLLHDYPAFLAGYHLSFCNVIPDNCVQLRNLVLSAFPRGMVLPDPFTPNLKIDVIPEMSKSPVVLSNVIGPINALRSDLDNFLKNRQSPDFLSGLLPRLCKEGSKEVDACKVNALVLYVGMHAIAKQQSSQISHRTSEMEVLQKLMDFGDRGRYIGLNAIANQLRFPSSHTHYFSCVMLYLFSEAKDEGVREQVTRVLLERLIVHRPHPWGLLVTFIELIKNQRYQFWSHPFTRCATEIEKVFENVARSCLTPGSQKASVVGEA